MDIKDIDKRVIENAKNIVSMYDYTSPMEYGEEENNTMKGLLGIIAKLENMYHKEYNEHMEKKRQNDVLQNNQFILMEKFRKLEEKGLKLDCTGKEWDHCRVEKMGCFGCDYFHRSIDKYIEDNTCLHCGKGRPRYCEDCYQELISKNIELQKQIDLMASFIAVAELDEDILKTYCGVALNGTCRNPDDHSCRECIKEYFKNILRRK